MNLEVSPMKNKGLLFLSFLLVFPVLTGCGHHDKGYIDFNKKVNKTQLGESSIANISKYSALGVGSLSSVKNQNNRLLNPNALISLRNESDDEIIDHADYSLLGLTNEGVVEELTLTMSSGESILSSSLNITYYVEIGDFILFSYLPMSTEEYRDGFRQIGWYDINSFEWEHLNYINNLQYPLIYSIRYQDKNGDYQYIDLSYLIHKKSGKIFPCSSHSAYIDPKKVYASGFTGFSERDYEIENKTIGDYIFNIEDGYDTRVELYEYYREYYSDTFRFECPESFSYLYSYSFNGSTFHNGFLISHHNSGTGEEMFSTIYNFPGIRLENNAIVMFNETTNDLSFERFSNFEVVGDLKCDKWGNFVIRHPTAGYRLYRMSDRKIMDYEFGFEGDAIRISFDSFTKQYYGGSRIEFHDDWIRYDGSLYSFYGEDLSVEYDYNTIEVISNNPNTPFYDIVGRITDSSGEVILIEDGYDNTEGVNAVNFIKIKTINEQGRYSEEAYSYELLTTLKNCRREELLHINGNYYCLINKQIYCVEANNGYRVIALEIPYTVSSLNIDYEHNVLAFAGYDKSTYDMVNGYITAENEVTFEVQEMKEDTINIFTPIN